MTARHRDLDNLAHRLDRAANTVPDVFDHLDEQRAFVSALVAQDYTTPHGSGAISDPTLRAAGQLDSVEYRRQTIVDGIETMIVCVKMLEQSCRAALAFRVSIHDDNLDHLADTPRCIGAQASITARCDQIPSPRPDGHGGVVDDGRCLDCGRTYDTDQAHRRMLSEQARRIRRHQDRLGQGL